MVVLVGEPRQVGGNTVQLTSKGKVQVTDAKGKTKVISQKSFENQLKQNAGKIVRGDEFEFKGASTTQKVMAGVGIAAAAAGLAAAVIYRKDIANKAKVLKDTIKNVDWKAFGKDFKGWMSEVAKPAIKAKYTAAKSAIGNAFTKTREVLGATYEAAKNVILNPKSVFAKYMKK